jgi:hypothetical protein
MLLSITWSKLFSVLDTKIQKAESFTLPLVMFKAPRLALMYRKPLFAIT